MTVLLRKVLTEQDYAHQLAQHGLATVRARHTCAHRVDELLDIYMELRVAGVTRASVGGPGN
jgi:spore maturation protein CgeB